MNGELLTVTLNAQQIREAIEEAVTARAIRDPVSEKAVAEVPDDLHIVVRVVKKRQRKSKGPE